VLDVIRFDLVSALGARIVLGQPGHDAVDVVQVPARQPCQSDPVDKAVAANTAFRRVVGELFAVKRQDSGVRQSRNRLHGGRRGALRARLLVLLNPKHGLGQFRATSTEDSLEFVGSERCVATTAAAAAAAAMLLEKTDVLDEL